MLIVILRNTHSHSFTQKHENKHNDQQICIKMKKIMEKNVNIYIYVYIKLTTTYKQLRT